MQIRIKELNSIADEEVGVNFKDVMFSASEAALFNNMFKNVDRSDKEKVFKNLVRFFNKTKHYIRVIEDPINRKESMINIDSYMKIEFIRDILVREKEIDYERTEDIY